MSRCARSGWKIVLWASTAFLPFGVTALHAQAAATASGSIIASAFIGATGTYTGLGGGRNFATTAGLDLGFRPI